MILGKREGALRVGFHSDGTCDPRYNAPFQVQTYSYLYDFDGNWELIDNDNKLKITYSRLPSYSRTFTIKRLEKKNLEWYLNLTSDSVNYWFTK